MGGDNFTYAVREVCGEFLGDANGPVLACLSLAGLLSFESALRQAVGKKETTVVATIPEGPEGAGVGGLQAG